MAYVKLKKAVEYRGREYGVGDILEVGEDLAGRMILSGQAVSSNAKEFEAQRRAEERKSAQGAELERLTKKELERLCEELGIECAKRKKEEIVALIKEKMGGGK